MTENTVSNPDVSTAASSPAAVSPSPVSDANAAPSPASTPDAPAASSPAPDATPASSTGEPDLKAGLLAAVKKAVEPKTEAAPTDGSVQAKPAEDASSSDPEDLPENVTPEEVKNYSPKAQKRIQKLIQEREGFRSQVQEIEPYREFMQEHDLSTEDLAFGLQAIAAVRKGDYEGFLKQVSPIIQLCLEYTGRSLPPDLQDQVKQGRIAPDVAVNMTKQRYDLGNAQQRLERYEQEQAVQYEENFRQANRSAVASWEQSIKQSDPDYARKLDVAKAYVASIRAEYGDPQSPDDAVAIAKEAYRRADVAMKAAQPTRAPTQMSPSGVQRPSNPSAVAAPRTLMEAAMQGLERARSRAS